MSLNIHPGVVCGYCIDPADAFLFAQINNGNALSLPFAKGFGWGAELNVRFIFEKAFTGRNGEGYPPERKEPQVRNAGILNRVKAAVVKRTTSIPCAPLISSSRRKPSQRMSGVVAGLMVKLPTNTASTSRPE